jgi:hypothetical protein
MVYLLKMLLSLHERVEKLADVCTPLNPPRDLKLRAVLTKTVTHLSPPATNAN